MGLAKDDSNLKKRPRNLNEADETGSNIIKCPLLHIHHFLLLEWVKHAFFNLLF